jgi:hypothetical protein
MIFGVDTDVVVYILGLYKLEFEVRCMFSLNKHQSSRDPRIRRRHKV